MKNSQTHADRINKIRTGLVTAGVQPALVSAIVGKFDALTPDLGRILAARTRFSVGTLEKLRNRGTVTNPNPEGRRQMCRAIYFLEDLECMPRQEALSPRTSSAFSAMWKQNFAALAERLRSAAQRFAPHLQPQRPVEPQVVFQPPPDPPVKRMVQMPPPRKYVMTAEMRSMMESLIRSRSDAVTYRQEVSTFLAGDTGFKRMVVMPEPKRYAMPSGMTAMFDRLHEKRRAHAGFGMDDQSSLRAAHTAWGHAIAGIQQHFQEELTKRVGTLASLQSAAVKAYKEFEALYGEIGSEIQGELSLAKSMFAMLESAPFPFSITGKIGSAVLGELHVDTQLPTTRALDGPAYFNNDLPLLVDLKLKLQSIRDWKDDITRLGVPASALTNEMTLSSAIDQARRDSLTLLNKVFGAALAENFGDTPEKKIIMATRFHDRVLESYAPGRRDRAPAPLLVHVVVTKITNFQEETKRAISDAVGSATMVAADDMQVFIELQLIADYMSRKFPKRQKEDFSGSVPEAIIKRLEGRPFNLVRRKSGKGQSVQIFGEGRLPWADGHSNHVGALVFFFRWYRRTINPFDLAMGARVQGLRESMHGYIRLLGAAVKDHTKSQLLGHDKTDWDAISRKV